MTKEEYGKVQQPGFEVREDFLKQEIAKYLNHWFSNCREYSDFLGLRLAKNLHFKQVTPMILMQRSLEFLQKIFI